MFRFFKKKSLEDHIFGTKKVKINGVIFHIKRIDAMDHLAGLNVLQKIYDVYKVNKDTNAQVALENFNKVKAYCRDMLLAGVVSPKLSAKDDGTGFFVEKLFLDFELAQALTKAILEFTYKKKLIRK